MTVRETIDARRAYRSLDPVDITEELIDDLSRSAQLAPSCFNNQPWRFVFVREPEALDALKGALSKGNAWATAASMIVAVVSRIDLDCEIHGREYFLFDTGMATAFIILRATELGLVAHPIAGYSEKKAKEALGVPTDMRLITLVIVGKHAEGIGPLLSEDQAESERERPERKPKDEIAFRDGYHEEAEQE
ncbi:MAG: nitroreductase family protein [Candidatus Eisenbacteria bacterium]